MIPNEQRCHQQSDFETFDEGRLRLRLWKPHSITTLPSTRDCDTDSDALHTIHVQHATRLGFQAPRGKSSDVDPLSHARAKSSPHAPHYRSALSFVPRHAESVITIGASAHEKPWRERK